MKIRDSLCTPADLDFLGDKNIPETNSVFWYIAHLPHKAVEGDRPMRY